MSPCLGISGYSVILSTKKPRLLVSSQDCTSAKFFSMSHKHHALNIRSLLSIDVNIGKITTTDKEFHDSFGMRRLASCIGVSFANCLRSNWKKRVPIGDFCCDKVIDNDVSYSE